MAVRSSDHRTADLSFRIMWTRRFVFPKAVQNVNCVRVPGTLANGIGGVKRFQTRFLLAFVGGSGALAPIGPRVFGTFRTAAGPAPVLRGGWL